MYATPPRGPLEYANGTNTLPAPAAAVGRRDPRRGFRIFTTSLVKCLPDAVLSWWASGQLPTLYQVAIGRSLLQAAQQRYRDPVWWLLEALSPSAPRSR